MNRSSAAAVSVLVVGLSSAGAPSAAQQHDRERGFAICLTITPGLGAAFLGHPGRGFANFALYGGGIGLTYAGARQQSSDLKGVGIAAVVGSFVWAAIDGQTLKPSAPLSGAGSLPEGWRPAFGPVKTKSGDALKVDIGQRVLVYKAGGAVWEGKVTAVSDISLTVDSVGIEKTIPFSEIERVEPLP